MINIPNILDILLNTTKSMEEGISSFLKKIMVNFFLQNPSQPKTSSLFDFHMTGAKSRLKGVVN